MSRVGAVVLAAGAAGGAVGGAVGLGYRLVVTGQATLDTGWGRTTRTLGPLQVTVEAPRELVFDVIAAPYLGRTPRALAGEIEVLERGRDMVVAAHHTPVGRSLAATTVESVRFQRPETVDFRLLRGPVPHVVERFALDELADGMTSFTYRGELGADFWALGRWWGDAVAKRWVATVIQSMERIQKEATRLALVKTAR